MSKETRNVSGVSYHHAEAGYFDKRQLQRSAGFWGLWGIGVAAVISGDFSGWNFGIGEAGWGGLAIASIVIVVKRGHVEAHQPACRSRCGFASSGDSESDTGCSGRHGRCPSAH